MKLKLKKKLMEIKMILRQFVGIRRDLMNSVRISIIYVLYKIKTFKTLYVIF